MTKTPVAVGSESRSKTFHKVIVSRSTPNTQVPPSLIEPIGECAVIHPTLTQLTTLGYQAGDRVYVRALLPKGIPMPDALKLKLAWEPQPGQIVPIPVDGYLTLGSNGASFTKLKRCKNSDKWTERQTYQDGLVYLEQLNQKGYGIYYVVNAGGRENSDIVRCPSLFYECDGIDKNAQWDKVKELTRSGYEPSLVVETRNSLHTYLLTHEQDVNSWRELQQRLIERQGSDPSIHNENRLMRLTGFLHWRWDVERSVLEPFPVALRLATTNIYSRAELSAFLPEWDASRWGKKQPQLEGQHRQEQYNGSVATDPSLDPFDIRNLATHLDGYNPDGRRGWITCRCPLHNGQSDNSLHIEQSTGAFRCHGGCDSKAVYHAAVELAKQRGYQLPERRAMGHSFSSLLGWLPRLKDRLQKQRRAPFKFGRSGEVKLEPAPARAAALEYPAGARLDVWQALVQQGERFILDVSGTGSGKSFDAGMSTPQLLAARQVVYVSSERRNPSTPTLAAWDDLEARHAGLYRDQFGKLRRSKDSGPLAVVPNCGRNETANALRTKNISNADSANVICRNCPHREPCQVGAVFGYLGQRRDVLASPRLRAHPSSLPSPSEYDYSDVVLIWDESSELLKAHKTIEVKLSDIDQTIVQLATKTPNLLNSLAPLLTGTLHQIVSGAIKQPNRFGWSDAQLRSVLPQLGSINIDEVRVVLAPNLNLLDTTQEHGVSLGDLPRGVRKQFVDTDAESAEKIKSSVVLQWLDNFLDILVGNTIGAFTIQYGTLTITLPDQRLIDIARAAKANILLDATARVEDLTRLLNVSHIPVIQQKEASTNNLEIIQVATLGRLGIGSDRSDFCQGRLDASVTELQKRHPDLAVVDFKRSTETEYQHRNWWTDTRGINDLENYSAIALIGTPCRSLASLVAEFTILYGRAPAEGTETVKYPIKVKGNLPDGIQPYFEMEVSADREFREFCRHRILADIKQALGRLRANRRPGEKLVVYFIADFPLDIEVTLKKASDFTPDAATKLERFEMAVRGAVEQLNAAGQKITQQAVAAIAGYSQQYISRFKSLLQTLLDNTNSKSSKNSDPPPDVGESQWLSSEYLPLLATRPIDEALEHLQVVFEATSAATFRQAWDATAAAVQTKILEMLLLILPAGEFRQLAAAMEVKI